MSEHDKRDVAIPADEAPNFVVSKPHVFARFKIFLNMPPGSNGLYHRLDCRCRRSPDQVVALFFRIADGATNEQAMACVVLPVMQEKDTCPIKASRTFRALTHRETLPILGCEQKGFDLTHFDLPAASVRSAKPHRLITSDSKHIWLALCFQPRAQLVLVSIDRVSHDPCNGDLRAVDTLDHLPGQFAFRLKMNGLRNASLAAALWIIDPSFGQIQVAINERMPTAGDISEKHGDLTVLNHAAGATILLLDPGGFLALFRKARFVDHQDGGFLPQLFIDIATQIVAHQTRIPHGLGEQALHAIGCGFPGVFSQLPAIFALGGTHETLQVAQCSTAWFGSGETRANARMQQC